MGRSGGDCSSAGDAGLSKPTQRTVRASYDEVVLRLVFVLILLLAACGRGYEDENRSIVADLPPIDGVVLIEEDHYGYCSNDSCPLGNDRSGALLTYTVDTDRYSQDSLIETYRHALPGWGLSVEEFYEDDDPSAGERIVSARFVSGDQEIALNLDNWATGRFELHVDARAQAD